MANVVVTDDLKSLFWHFFLIGEGKTVFTSNGQEIMVDLILEGMHPNLTVAAVVDMVDYMQASDVYTTLTHVYNLSIDGLAVTEVEIDFQNSVVTVILGDQLPIKTLQTLEDQFDRLSGVDFSIMVEVQINQKKEPF
ncbi:MAG TPA: hypothetical protein VIY48_21585 [Candidatus Paceibacterota bacterium]